MVNIASFLVFVNMKGKVQLEVLSADGKIILKLIIKRY